MTDPTPWSHILRLSDLGGRRDSVFDLSPDAPTRQSLAADLDISGIKKLRFQGNLSPVNQRDWQLTATIGATVVQPCVVTLALVSTRIDATITRQYLAEFEHPTTTGEIEMPEDDTAEPLPVSLDLGHVMAEALALYLPDFPRAQGAELGESVFTAPGQAPMRDEDARPFAGLAALRNTLGDAKDS